MELKCMDYTNDRFNKVLPNEFAQKIKIRFQQDPDLWFGVITPKSKAEELLKATDNDYSLIWHTHCDNCFKTIDKSLQENCFVSEDEITWLCNKCYCAIFGEKAE